MNRAIVPLSLKEDHRRFLPSDLNSWSFKNRNIAKPIADFIGKYYLDSRIHKRISLIKKDDPSVAVGETHCHSTFSDGMHSVKSILNRASRLGLDYVVITDHFTPGKWMSNSVIHSLKKQVHCINEWTQPTDPINIYPAFEISTLEGHLVLIFEQEYLSDKKISDILLEFSDFNYQFPSMLDIIPRIGPLGGVSIIAHPDQIRPYPFGASIKWLKGNLIGLVDGIEDISAGHGYKENYGKELGLASIGSTDDHCNLLMGTVVTAYNKNNHNNLISAIKSKETKALIVDNSMEPILKLARCVF